MKKTILLFSAATMLLAGCATNPYTGEDKTANAVWGSLIGAGVGAGTGALASGNREKGALVGGLAGALAGGGIGYYMDVQEAELRKELFSTGVSVVREGDNIRLVMPGNVTFVTNSADINSGFYPTLNSVAKVLNKYSNSTVSVAGHTDSTGSNELNIGLSQRRAGAVASYLQTQNVKATRFEVIGAGKSSPIASNDTEDGRAQNRRVEIKIVPTK